MLYYYMYRHLYCYTLNRSVFIKWEGKAYIITHNYLYTQVNKNILYEKVGGI